MYTYFSSAVYDIINGFIKTIWIFVKSKPDVNKILDMRKAVLAVKELDC